MKKALLLLTLFPYVALAQLRNVDFDARHVPVPVSRDNPASITRALGLSEDFSFRGSRNAVIENEQNQEHYFFQQYYNNVPVEYSSIQLHYRNGQVYYLNGAYATGNAAVVQATIRENQALSAALAYTNAEVYIWNNDKELQWLNENEPGNLIFPSPHATMVYYPRNNGDEIVLTYKFDIYATNPLSRKYIYVDAATGAVVGEQSRICNSSADTRYSGTRSICTQYTTSGFRLYDNSDCNRANGIHTMNMQTGTTYSAAVDFFDNNNNWTAAEYNNTSKDNAALDAHWGAEMTYDYFRIKHNRRSYDNNYAQIRNYVHFSSSYDNAFWNGSVMTYGDGSTYDALTSLDIVAHEIGHAVCDYTAALVYQNESGALNESLSDIWGACVEFFATTGKQTWVCGEDVSGGSGLRSMSNPNSNSNPDTYQGTYWYTGSADNGGVHTNSSVMNFWFYLLTSGGSGTNDLSNSFNVTAIGIDKAAAIVYRAEVLYMSATTNYAGARSATIQAARDLFGDCSQEVESTINAWYAVGVGTAAPPHNLYITSTINSGSMVNYEAYHIIASNHIQANTVVEYAAALSVALNPGFSTIAGTVFLAHIGNCANIIGLKPNEENNNNGVNASAHGQTIGSLENTMAKRTTIYPNPSTGTFTVNLPSAGAFTLNVFNSVGVLIYKTSINGTHQEVSLDPALPSGNYIVQITGADFRLTERLSIIK